MSSYEVRYADSFRCIDAENADAARAIAVALDAKVHHLSSRPVVEVVEIVNEEDSLFWQLFHADEAVS